MNVSVPAPHVPLRANVTPDTGPLHLTGPELEALAKIAKLDRVGAAWDVTHVRDQASVGWLDCTVATTIQGASRLRTRNFRLTPFGHIFEDVHGYGVYEQVEL